MVISEIPDTRESKRGGKTPQVEAKLNNLSLAQVDTRCLIR